MEDHIDYIEWSAPVDATQALEDAKPLVHQLIGTEGGHITDVKVEKLLRGSGRIYRVVTTFDPINSSPKESGAHFAELRREKDGSILITFERGGKPNVKDVSRVQQAVSALTGRKVAEVLEPEKNKLRFRLK